MTSMPAPPDEGAAPEVGGVLLCLSGGPFVVRAGRRVELPEAGRRLVALVALRGGTVDRRCAAGTLWPDSSEERASGNLRSVLWRLRCSGSDLLEADPRLLRLRPGTDVDVARVLDWAVRLVDGSPRPDDLAVRPDHVAAFDLLPGWYDEWVACEREHLRQRLLHALEALARHLAARGRWSAAVDAALAVVAMEPLRESAQRVLVEVHLAEGNLVEARRVVAAYRALLRAELGVDVSERLLALLGVTRG